MRSKGGGGVEEEEEEEEGFVKDAEWWRETQKADGGVSHHKSSYCRRCILWMMSRQSLNTRRMFSVSTAQVKWG